MAISNSKIFPDPVVKGNLVREKASNKTQGEKCDLTGFLGIVIQDVLADGIPFEIQNVGIPIDSVPIGHAATIRSGEGEILTDIVHSSFSVVSEGDNLGIRDGAWSNTYPNGEIYGKLLEKDYQGITGQHRIAVFKTAVAT